MRRLLSCLLVCVQMAVCGCVSSGPQHPITGPGDTVRTMFARVEAHDWGAAYDIMSERVLKETDRRLQSAVQAFGSIGDDEYATKFKKLTGLKGRELLVEFTKMAYAMQKTPPDLETTVVKEEVNGDRAKVTIKTLKTGRTTVLDMIKEGGVWKIDTPGFGG